METNKGIYHHQEEEEGKTSLTAEAAVRKLSMFLSISFFLFNLTAMSTASPPLFITDAAHSGDPTHRSKEREHPWLFRFSARKEGDAFTSPRAAPAVALLEVVLLLDDRRRRMNMEEMC